MGYLSTANRFKIVDEESAAPILPDVERASIQANHSMMCKFENDNSPGFDLIVDGIQRYAEEAPLTMRQRWIAEKQERLNQKLRKAKELVPGAIGSFICSPRFKGLSLIVHCLLV